MSNILREPELAPQFDPTANERDVYALWAAAGVFHAESSRSERNGGDRSPFTLVIPPPNVTAVLHMGHGLNNTVQDVIVRWRRMAGDEALWVPGTDHAGIATQNVVEKALASEGQTRFDLGREAFVTRTAAFVAETGGTILKQLEAIGASCDWSRTAYTLSPELSLAVREAFVQLYEKGLVYRGHRVIHWCPRCLTSLSDEEAEHKETSGKLYHISYPLADGSGRSITVATTRPETMLGDVAIAVHPEDARYRDLVGRMAMLPIANIEIPIIADEYTDPAFGSGAVKITPAHDANDFEVGVRHSLPMPVVITPEGRMDEVAIASGRVPQELRGLDRFDARSRIVEMLRGAGRLEKVEPHTHSVRQCYRCDTVVEPRLSDQWFVRMAPLARPALAAVRNGEIRILPERWEGVYTNWMENIRDWNISRQLWWGHRIPVWYCDACPETIVSRLDVAVCPKCAGPVRQDEDVLDTWFSSWLWPFSTLGWPNEKAPDLRAFYPTDMLVTAPEILFFWVARMVMAGYAFMGRAPFHTVYLHGTVRDANHVKMSKSLGNGIDPLDVVSLYGADALRYTVVAGMGMGADIILDPNDLEKSFTPGRNFATKLWNIGRFLLHNIGSDPLPALADIDQSRLSRADRWIIARLHDAIVECDAALGPAKPSGDGTWRPEQRYEGLRLNEYVETARRFAWNELADWYVESAKGRLTDGSPDREIARTVLLHVFDQALRLLHPVVPFITETLWQRLPGRANGQSLALAEWPRATTPIASDADSFNLERSMVSAIRQIRAEYNVAPGRQIDAVIVRNSGMDSVALAEITDTVGRLAKARVSTASHPPEGAAAHALVGEGWDIVVPLAGAVDVGRECARLRSELAQLSSQLDTLTQRLSNERFIARAPATVISAEKEKQRDWAARRDQLTSKIENLCADS
ncbi:MAG: valine--tRNA ligase [Gemmatimonadota bacterium]|nr:valine--tRNA ligase [Gemmatimonadota bacterium]